IFCCNDGTPFRMVLDNGKVPCSMFKLATSDGSNDCTGAPAPRVDCTRPDAPVPAPPAPPDVPPAPAPEAPAPKPPTPPPGVPDTRPVATPRASAPALVRSRSVSAIERL